MMRRIARIAVLLFAPAAIGASSVEAHKAPAGRWQVSRTTDPITGATTCLVAAFDQARGTSFSRNGALYPFVENNPRLGLLVGVSSGGRFRIPTGDILWRVDDRPFRTLLAKDNPPAAPASALTSQDAADKAMADMDGANVEHERYQHSRPRYGRPGDAGRDASRPGAAVSLRDYDADLWPAERRNLSGRPDHKGWCKAVPARRIPA